MLVSVQLSTEVLTTFLTPLESFTNNAVERIKEVVEYHNNNYREHYTHNQQPKGFIDTLKFLFK